MAGFYRPALMYVIEAARTICGMAPGTARKLLELALQELDGKENLRVIAAQITPRTPRLALTR